MKRYRTLSKREYSIIEEKHTEPPGSGVYESSKEEGVYVCKRCDTPLYLSSHKFYSGCGWPSFDAEIENGIERKPDPDGRRTEIVCKQCHAHLGHIFIGENLTQHNIRHCVNSLSLLFIPAITKEGLHKAIFGGGCFWGIEYWMKKLPGIKQIKSGYIGGHVEKPTYEEVCSGLTGHVEAVEILFDPCLIKYETLAKCFFEIHDPYQKDGQGPDLGPQYLSSIFYLTEKQKVVALQLKSFLEQKDPIATRILPASTFYPAEEYHQRYYEKTGKRPYCHFKKTRF